MKMENKSINVTFVRIHNLLFKNAIKINENIQIANENCAMFYPTDLSTATENTHTHTQTYSKYIINYELRN